MNDRAGSSAAAAVPIREARARIRAWWFLAAWYGLAVVSGIGSVWSSESPTIEFLMTFTMTLCAAGWVLCDAREHGRPIQLFSQQWLVLAGPVLVPVYILRSRGWRGILYILLHFLGSMLVFAVVAHTVGTLVYGAAWWEAMQLGETE